MVHYRPLVSCRGRRCDRPCLPFRHQLRCQLSPAIIVPDQAVWLDSHFAVPPWRMMCAQATTDFRWMPPTAIPVRSALPSRRPTAGNVSNHFDGRLIRPSNHSTTIRTFTYSARQFAGKLTLQPYALAGFYPQGSQRLWRDRPGDLQGVVRLHAKQPCPQFRIHLAVYLAAVVAECEQGKLDLLDDLPKLVGVTRERLERRRCWGDRGRLVSRRGC